MHDDDDRYLMGCGLALGVTVWLAGFGLMAWLVLAVIDWLGRH